MSTIVPPTDLDGGIVLFDGVCNLCNGFVQFLIRRDGHRRLRFGALQSPEAAQYLKASSVRPEDLNSVVYLRQGQVLTRSKAALYILKDLGLPWSISFALIIIPNALRDAVYDLIARKRYRWFGRTEQCMVPTPELRHRFIDGLP